MQSTRDAHFELQPVFRSAISEIAAFLQKWGRTEAAAQSHFHESVEGIERRLGWLLGDHPLAASEPVIGYCLRDRFGAIRGVDLCFPAAFLWADQRLLGLCSGTFFVEAEARSMGFYLFKKCFKSAGYSFQFCSTCNAASSELWKVIGAAPVPNSDVECFMPVRLDIVMAACVAYVTSSQAAARIARVCGRSANPILRFLTRPSAKFSIEPCQDWEKLSELSRRHRCPDYITSDRSPAFLHWRYGSGSPVHSCGAYVFRDERGHEGWFALGYVNRGKEWPLRTAVLLDVIWPRERISYKTVFEEIVRAAAVAADAISFRRQPGLDYADYHPCMISRKLGAPRAFVSLCKGAPGFAPDLFDYDDSDHIAWGFPWNEK